MWRKQRLGKGMHEAIQLCCSFSLSLYVEAFREVWSDIRKDWILVSITILGSEKGLFSSCFFLGRVGIWAYTFSSTVIQDCFSSETYLHHTFLYIQFAAQSLGSHTLGDGDISNQVVAPLRQSALVRCIGAGLQILNR